MTDPTQSVADAAFEAWIDAQENPRALLQSEVWLAAFASGAQAELEHCLAACRQHERACQCQDKTLKFTGPCAVEIMVLIRARQR